MTDVEHTLTTSHDEDAWRFAWTSRAGHETELHWRRNSECWQRYVRLADPDGTKRGWSEQQVALPQPRDEQHAAEIAEAHSQKSRNQ